MKYIILIILLITGCGLEPKLITKSEMEEFCKNCGGLRSGIADTYVVDVQCNDGHKLRMATARYNRTFVLGKCK